MRTRHPLIIALCSLIPLVASAAEPNATVARNVIIVTIDGLRWQEVMGGYDPALNTKDGGGVGSPAALERLWRKTSAEEARQMLMPFFWQTVATKGQVFGDRGLKNVGHVTNPYRFSYPGYSELFCGFADPRIDSNKAIPNPNVTVFEWLNRQPGFEGKVAVYGAWDVVKAIVNNQRSGIRAVAGWDPIAPVAGASLSETEKLVNELLATSTRQWADEPPDALIAQAALDHFVRQKPRVFWVSLGEPDEWAHGRRYDLYLESTRRCDEFVKKLWETAQAMPEYAGNTALIITTDHGRGVTPADWTSHGARVVGAEGWWAGVMGPGIAAKGVAGEGEVVQSQIAATVAALIGQDWLAAEKRAAESLVKLGK